MATSNLTALQLIVLQGELLAGHPDTGPYDADDGIAAEELNAPNRPDIVTIAEILKFLLLDNVYQTVAPDDQDRSLWRRMREVVSLSEVPSGTLDDPWGTATQITEIRQLKTHELLSFFTLSAQGDLPVDLTDSNFQSFLAGAQAAGVMSEAQETALLNLANNRQGRGEELKLGSLAWFDVEAARAL